ncbi:MAG: helix-turn-helix transcriptional regulator [bacterium]|nr:helix-turn-helix transcriptional regulator [bacterium]
MRKLKEENYNFRDSLRYVRKSQGVSLRSVAHAVGVTPTYISDIERGNNKAPGIDLLEKLLDAMFLDEPAAELRNYLYDLAAKERKEVAGDIAEYIMKQEELRTVIRIAQKRNADDKVWEKCMKMLQ